MVRARRRYAAILAALAAATALVLGEAPASASPQPTTTNTAKVDCVVFDAAANRCDVVGVVYAVTHVGDRTYIGGRFAGVNGVPRANVAAIRADGTLDPTWNAPTDGIVYALAASSDGSAIFMGGAFTTVHGQARRLAAVDAETGALVGSWTTNTSNNLIRALAVHGDRLYVGGSFSRIGGRAITRLAAVDLGTTADGDVTGTVDQAFNPGPSGTIRGLAVSDGGGSLYAVGGFNAMSGAARPGAAELTAATGALTGFAPTEGGVVIAVDVSPSGRLYYGTTSNRTYAYDPQVGNAPLYRVRTGGDVQAILALDDEVYIGGHFDTVPEQKLNRLALASFNPANGLVTDWNPGANGHFGVWALGLSGTPEPFLSVGGDFTRVAGAARRGYARFNF